MALTPAERQRIEEEELLRFKTRRTLEVCEEYLLLRSQNCYRHAGVAFVLRSLLCGASCAAWLGVLFPEALRSGFPAIAAFVVGLLAPSVLIWRKKSEYAVWRGPLEDPHSFWGAPLNMATYSEILLERICIVAVPVWGSIFWIRSPGIDYFGTGFQVVSVLFILVTTACALNYSPKKSREVAAEMPRIEYVFSDVRKRQEEMPAQAAPTIMKAASGTRQS